MRLTKYIRQAFVRAAMDDVPKIDYDAELRKLFDRIALEALPKEVAALLSNPIIEPFLHRDWVSTPSGMSNLPAYISRRTSEAFISGANPKGWEELKAMLARKQAQEDARRELRYKLEGCAASVNSRKQLADLLPEFEKYLPESEPAAIRTLPVVANVVSDFVKAGWPKEKASK